MHLSAEHSSATSQCSDGHSSSLTRSVPSSTVQSIAYTRNDTLNCASTHHLYRLRYTFTPAPYTLPACTADGYIYIRLRAAHGNRWAAAVTAGGGDQGTAATSAGIRVAERAATLARHQSR